MIISRTKGALKGNKTYLSLFPLGLQNKPPKNVVDTNFKDFYNKSCFPFITEFSDNYDDLVNVIDAGTIGNQMTSPQGVNTRKKTLKQDPSTLLKCFLGDFELVPN